MKLLNLIVKFIFYYKFENNSKHIICIKMLSNINKMKEVNYQVNKCII